MTNEERLLFDKLNKDREDTAKWCFKTCPFK